MIKLQHLVQAWNNVCYLIRGIAKRLYRDKQSTPTPHRYLGPLSGSGYTTSMSEPCFIQR